MPDSETTNEINTGVLGLTISHTVRQKNIHAKEDQILLLFTRTTKLVSHCKHNYKFDSVNESFYLR